MAEVATPLHSPLQSLTNSVEIEQTTTTTQNIPTESPNPMTQNIENDEIENKVNDESDDTNNEEETLQNDDDNNNIDEDANENQNEENDEKSNLLNDTQQGPMLNIEYGHCSKQGIRASMEVLPISLHSQPTHTTK